MSMNTEQGVETNVGTKQDVLRCKAATDAVVLQNFTRVEMDEAVMVSNKTVITLFSRVALEKCEVIHVSSLERNLGQLFKSHFVKRS